MGAKIAIYGNRSQTQNIEGLQLFLSYLLESGFRVYLQTRYAQYLCAQGIETGEAVPVDSLPPGVELVVSLGGDGTFLRAAAWVGEKEIPIVGINTGHLGYLSACGLDEAKEMVEIGVFNS